MFVHTATGAGGFTAVVQVSRFISLNGKPPAVGNCVPVAVPTSWNVAVLLAATFSVDTEVLNTMPRARSAAKRAATDRV